MTDGLFFSSLFINFFLYELKKNFPKRSFSKKSKGHNKQLVVTNVVKVSSFPASSNSSW